MAPTRKNIDHILARVNFPLYTIQMLSNRHVIVGGGGGSSKTGVANGFEIFELSHDGKKFIAEEVTRHETGPSVVMNCSAYSDSKRSFLVAGQESHCQLYSVESILVTEEDKVENVGDNHDVRERKPKAKQKTDNNKNVKKKLKFKIKPMDSVQTDSIGQEPLLRVMRIGLNGKMLATGGTDNNIRLWKFPTLEPLTTLKVHKKEIDDIDFSPYGYTLITIAKDGIAVLWDCLKGKELSKLHWKQPEGSKYLYKRCRFGIVEGTEAKEVALFMLANPTGVAGKQKSYLQLWLSQDGYKLRRVLPFNESLSALAVRDDGRFVAVGTMFSGSVSIHAAFSLQKVLNISGAHSMFVTGLEFLPVSSDNHTASSVAEAAVLSISVDNHVCIHTLPYRKTMPAWIGILILILTLFMTFVFCSYLGI